MNARTVGLVAIVLGDFFVLVAAIYLFVSFAAAAGSEFSRDRILVTPLSGVALAFVGAVLVLADRRARVNSSKTESGGP